MTADQPLLDAALAYATRGFRVLPLHHPIKVQGRQQPGGVGCSCGDPGCGPVGKHPRTPHGLHDATADPDRLARWWQRWPQANIGLVTGGRADVLDIDGPAGRTALRGWVTQHQLRLEGPLVRTGSGWQHYLAATGTGNRAGLLEHVDWRGIGGYVVARAEEAVGAVIDHLRQRRGIGGDDRATAGQRLGRRDAEALQP